MVQLANMPELHVKISWIPEYDQNQTDTDRTSPSYRRTRRGSGTQTYGNSQADTQNPCICRVLGRKLGYLDLGCLCVTQLPALNPTSVMLQCHFGIPTASISGIPSLCSLHMEATFHVEHRLHLSHVMVPAQVQLVTASPIPFMFSSQHALPMAPHSAGLLCVTRTLQNQGCMWQTWRLKTYRECTHVNLCSPWKMLNLLGMRHLNPESVHGRGFMGSTNALTSSLHHSLARQKPCSLGRIKRLALRYGKF